jgi:mRNA interferase RelE/StbE
MLRIDPSRQAQKFLRTLPPKQARQVANKILALRQHSQPPDAKQLRGHPYWRADVGEYRIIYRVEQETLIVPLIGKRNDAEIYRRLRRRG